MAYITKEYLENNIKNYDQYRKLDKEGQANGLATLDANGKLVSAQIPSGVGAATYQGNTVTSIVAGSNTAMSISNGELTIASTAAGNGNVPAYTSADANKILVVNNSGTGIRWGEGPFYEEGTTDNDKFTFAIEKYNVAYYWGAPIFAFTGDKNGPAFNNSLTAYNTIMNNNGGHVIGPDEIADITSSIFIGLTITCPSNVIFAQLDRPIYAPANPGYTMNGSIISTSAGDKQQISIQNSNPAIGFPVDSITVGNPGYASLKFTTVAHTYNATIKITAMSGRTGTVYTPTIIF